MALTRFIEANGRVYSLDTEIGKEYAKWEGRPYTYQPYPKMIYRAQHLPGNGRWATAADVPARHGFRDSDEWARAVQQAENFTSSCQKTVNNEDEHKAALNGREGWRNSQQEAVEYAEAHWKAEGNEAGERAYRDRNMSDKAKAEAFKAEAEVIEELGVGHVPEIPEKRRGRPRKSAAA